MYRPDGGASRLTLRRMLLLVDQLPPESAFVSELNDRVPISTEAAASFSVYQALSGQVHPLWTHRQRERDAMELEAALRAARDRARTFNAGKIGSTL